MPRQGSLSLRLGVLVKVGDLATDATGDVGSARGVLSSSEVDVLVVHLKCEDYSGKIFDLL